MYLLPFRVRKILVRKTLPWAVSKCLWFGDHFSFEKLELLWLTGRPFSSRIWKRYVSDLVSFESLRWALFGIQRKRNVGNTGKRTGCLFSRTTSFGVRENRNIHLAKKARVKRAPWSSSHCPQTWVWYWNLIPNFSQVGLYFWAYYLKTWLRYKLAVLVFPRFRKLAARQAIELWGQHGEPNEVVGRLQDLWMSWD